jgi:hypothetical protein
MGVFGDCLPFVILRQRQTTDSGRSYAYSLLLDPGREVWETFDWNGADLIDALLASEVSERLLHQPETCTEESLRRALSALVPSKSGADPMPLDEQATAHVEVFRNCMIGAAITDGATLAPPTSFGLERRPQPSELSPMIGQVEPLCFRVGSGWLLGGSQEHGLSLGARFVIDDDTSEDNGLLGERATRGQQVLHAWNEIVSHSEVKNTLMELASVPLCRWPCNGATAHERLLLLARMLGQEELSEELLRGLEQKLRSHDFLAQDIRRAAHRRVLEGTGQITRAQSAFVVGNYFEYGLSLLPEQVERLDAGTLIEYSVDYEKKGEAGFIPLSLSKELRFEVFLRTLGASESYRQVPELLLGAYRFSVENFTGYELEERVRQLSEAAEQRTFATSESLDVWDGFSRTGHRLWPKLAKILRDAVFKRVQTRHVDWEAEYLRFGQDPGGEELYEMYQRRMLGQDEASQVAQRCIMELSGSGSLADAATAWLTALAASRLRHVVHTNDKIIIARSEVSGEWHTFLALWDAYCNQPLEVEPEKLNHLTRLRDGVARDAARAVLYNDLRQMLREKPLEHTLPDLIRIKGLLGTLPDDIQTAITNLRPGRHTTSTLKSWTEGLLEIGAASDAADQIIHFAVTSRAEMPEGWLFDNFPEKKLEELAVKLLFTGHSFEDDDLRRRCQEILSDEDVRRRAGKTFEQIHKEYLKKDKDSRENFLRRYLWHEDALDALFACFSEAWQKNVVRHIVEHNDDEFLRRASRILEEAHADESPTPPYRLAVLDFIASRNQSALRKKFVGRLALGSKKLDILSQILGREAARKAEHFADVEECRTAAAVFMSRDAWPSPPAEASSDDMDSDSDESDESDEGAAVLVENEVAAKRPALLRARLKPIVAEPKSDTSSSFLQKAVTSAKRWWHSLIYDESKEEQPVQNSPSPPGGARQEQHTSPETESETVSHAVEDDTR